MLVVCCWPFGWAAGVLLADFSAGSLPHVALLESLGPTHASAAPASLAALRAVRRQALARGCRVADKPPSRWSSMFAAATGNAAATRRAAAAQTWDMQGKLLEEYQHVDGGAGPSTSTAPVPSDAASPSVQHPSEAMELLLSSLFRAVQPLAEIPGNFEAAISALWGPGGAPPPAPLPAAGAADADADAGAAIIGAAMAAAADGGAPAAGEQLRITEDSTALHVHDVGQLKRLQSPQQLAACCAVTDMVAVSRAGNFTCPVRTGAVLLGAVTHATQTPEAWLDACVAAETVLLPAQPTAGRRSQVASSVTGIVTQPAAPASSAAAAAANAANPATWTMAKELHDKLSSAREHLRTLQQAEGGTAGSATQSTAAVAVAAEAVRKLEQEVSRAFLHATTSQMACGALDDLNTSEQVVAAVRAGRLPRIVQHRLLLNAEVIEFERCVGGLEDVDTCRDGESSGAGAGAGTAVGVKVAGAAGPLAPPPITLRPVLWFRCARRPECFCLPGYSPVSAACISGSWQYPYALLNSLLPQQVCPITIMALPQHMQSNLINVSPGCSCKHFAHEHNISSSPSQRCTEVLFEVYRFCTYTFCNTTPARQLCRFFTRAEVRHVFEVYRCQLQGGSSTASPRSRQLQQEPWGSLPPATLRARRLAYAAAGRAAIAAARLQPPAAQQPAAAATTAAAVSERGSSRGGGRAARKTAGEAAAGGSSRNGISGRAAGASALRALRGVSEAVAVEAGVPQRLLVLSAAGHFEALPVDDDVVTRRVGLGEAAWVDELMKAQEAWMAPQRRGGAVAAGGSGAGPSGATTRDCACCYYTAVAAVADYK